MTAIMSNFSPSYSEEPKLTYDRRVVAPQTILKVSSAPQKGKPDQIQQIPSVGENPDASAAQASYGDIPVIDFSRLADDADAVCKQLGDAAAQWGAFQVINHGIPLDTMQKIESQGMNFFRSPSDFKLAAGSVYFPLNAEYPNSLLQRVERVAFTPGPKWKFQAKDINSLEDTLSRIWPDGNPLLREEMRKYLRGSEALNVQIMQLLARYLDLGEDFFTQHFHRAQDTWPRFAVRWNFYPSHPNPSENPGAKGHTDPGTLTILMQDRVGGLRIRRDGRWYGVKPIEGALVVNMGDSLEAWTNGRLKSVIHEVQVNTKLDRLSMINFVSPEPSLPLSPPAQLMDEDHPRVYREPLTYENLMEKRAEDIVDDGGSKAVRILDHFKIRK
ncbi:protein MpDOXC31 [Marchantia polymorpha subsp. ruderalis]|uniref:Fe2OG dioxygenase domain-containing protein n=2 Tax=Marchantia polymorpha TaxID=3197 RepID=A0A176WCB5_MARPO|nr:hypothetical protein AXG93_3893s1320 [Marchantia polymorpha subsp. ruderalis]PTQ38299.1 hypothetical protein MARPO_0052s0083 [Marchantia polymorpha]BBN13149.1 hypothetical protein Mp_6g01210 [Marchantia polymorpha subsp. ruderalis]|eukprot:PTQ38299.1 hypothetical protein MARPO_0052s0083 [Marchantia polymorpha]